MIEFIHPVSGVTVSLAAPVPDETLWRALEEQASIGEG
jgi:hypothetical protein